MNTVGSGATRLPEPPRLTLPTYQLDDDRHPDHDTQREPGMGHHAILLGLPGDNPPGLGGGRLLPAAVLVMSDNPQPHNDPQQPPAHIEEEPLRQPPYPDDDWDGEDEDEDTAAALYPPGSVLWDGVGWPSPEHWWP